MKNENRGIVYDQDLQIEAYFLRQTAQPFPAHFHDHYVIGCLKQGSRRLICKGQKFEITAGDVLIFNPYDTHACQQQGEEMLGYLALNISIPVMASRVEKMTGKAGVPVFNTPIVSDSAVLERFLDLHRLIMNKAAKQEKEKAWSGLLALLFKDHVPAPAKTKSIQSQMVFSSKKQKNLRKEVAAAIHFIDQNYLYTITLDQLCAQASLSKSTLLRTFISSFGLSPYRYLETVRIMQAKKQLEQGISCACVAAQTGYFDQSHFSRCFLQMTGLTPSLYQQGYKEVEREKDNERKE